jgi:hypothetical protein
MSRKAAGFIHSPPLSKFRNWNRVPSVVAFAEILATPKQEMSAGIRSFPNRNASLEGELTPYPGSDQNRSRATAPNAAPACTVVTLDP